MNTDIENVLRTLEVARTKLELLARDASQAAAYDAAIEELNQIVTALKSPGNPVPHAAPPLSRHQSADPLASAFSDFTRIKNIDAERAKKLHQAGLKTFEDIAVLQADDVATLSSSLSLALTINRENWIEQAAILAKGKQTLYARRLPPTEAIDRSEETPAKVEPDAVNAEVDAPTENPTPAPTPETIPAVTATTAAALATAAVNTAIAKPPENDAEQPSSATAAPENLEVREVTAPALAAAPEPATSTRPSPSMPVTSLSNDDREATIEIKPRPDAQRAYPNDNEDPELVVKRFMRALVGEDKDK